MRFQPFSVESILMGGPVDWEAAASSLSRMGIDIPIESLKEFCRERGIETGRQFADSVYEIIMYFTAGGSIGQRS